MVPEDMLMKEIVLVYWSDIIVFYNFLSKEVREYSILLDFIIARLLQTFGHTHLFIVL